jgi:hypothetical protein
VAGSVGLSRAFICVHYRDKTRRPCGAGWRAHSCSRSCTDAADANLTEVELAHIEYLDYVENAWKDGGRRHRRLLGIELTVRDLESFSLSNPSIIDAVRLPSFEQSDRMIWPPPQTPMSVLVAAAMTPPHDPRFSADWGAAREKDEARRAASKHVGARKRKRVRQRVGVRTRRVCEDEFLARWHAHVSGRTTPLLSTSTGPTESALPQ